MKNAVRFQVVVYCGDFIAYVSTVLFNNYPKHTHTIQILKTVYFFQFD